MDTRERPTSMRTDLHPPPDRPRVVAVDDLARTVVNLLVAGADVQAMAAPDGIRVSVADERGHRLLLVERPATSG